MKQSIAVPTAILIGIASQCYAFALSYSGIEFSQGTAAFADGVAFYSSPVEGVLPPYDDPSNALGAPNYNPATEEGFVSLGTGSLILVFKDNALIASGNSLPDLAVFEIGMSKEATWVEISQTGDNWISVGMASGSTSTIDIDAFVGPGGVQLGAAYTYVKLTDTRRPLRSPSPWAGADIDAIGVISYAGPESVPDTGSSFLLLSSALVGILGLGRKLVSRN